MSYYHHKILKELCDLERQEQVRILYACESGSRAWGFPSKDSDYDVRFLYIRPKAWYLSIRERRDVIERPINELLDINGWDLQKALKLFRKSNPPLLEWLNSPIPYFEKYSAAERMRGLTSLAFSPKSCMHHYLHMARRNYMDYLQGEQVRLKKYFYVLRPVLACGWIEKFRTMPPVAFDALVDALVPEESGLRQGFTELIARKKASEELDAEPRILYLHDFLEERIAYFERIVFGMSEAESVQDEALDALFLDVLDEVWAD